MTRSSQKAQEGHSDAREPLIARYSALVPLTLQKRLLRAPQRLHDDLIAAGYVALVKAVDSFDPERGIAFTSYAILRIYGAMLEELRKDDWTPRSVRDAQKRGEPVTILAQVSLESIIYEDETGNDLTLLESLADPGEPIESAVPTQIEREVVRTLVRCLPWRERRVVELHYWEDQPHHRIAERLGLSQSRVHQLHDQSLMLLRATMEACGVCR